MRRVPASFGFGWISRHARELAVEVPVRPAEGRCVYLSPEAARRLGQGSRAKARAHIERKLLFRTAPFSAFPSEREHSDKVHGKKLLADLYFCHGAISLGSGRAVFEGGYQLKGVGRTQLAGVHDYFVDSSGSSTLFASLIETANGAILEKVLTSGTMACDFVCLLGRTPERVSADLRTILGRRGSPVRLTHLEFLRGSLLRYGRDVREARWLLLARELLEQVAPFPHRFNVDDVVRAGRAILQRALILTAEARLFGLDMAFWGDNYDIFGRLFDLGDTDCHFPRIRLGSELQRPPPRAKYSPARFFSALHVLPEPHRSFDFTLYPVRNALAALEILCTGAGLDLESFDAAYDWDLLEREWRRALAHVRSRLPRLLGLRRGSGLRRRLDLPLVHQGRAPTQELDFETLIGGPARGIVGAMGYGKLNAFRRRLRLQTREAISEPASRGGRIPLWDDRDLLKLFSAQ